jgi:predicted transcriptional regulator
MNAFSTVVESSKQSGQWNYYKVPAATLKRTIKELAVTLGRSEAAIKAHINNAVSIKNLSSQNKDKHTIDKLVYHKRHALKVGLINLDTYMEALTNALKQKSITVNKLQTYLEFSNHENPVVNSNQTYKHTVKVNLKKRSIVHYTHEERVKLFTLIKAELGTYEELCDIFNCSVISYNQVPKEIWDAMKNVAESLGNSRTASAVKGQLNIITHKILNPDDDLTKGKLDTVNAAIEAGFIDGVTA